MFTSYLPLVWPRAAQLGSIRRPRQDLIGPYFYHPPTLESPENCNPIVILQTKRRPAGVQFLSRQSSSDPQSERTVHNRRGRRTPWGQVPRLGPAPTELSMRGRSSIGGVNSGDWRALVVASTDGGAANSLSPAPTTPISTNRRAVTRTLPSSEPTALL